MAAAAVLVVAATVTAGVVTGVVGPSRLVEVSSWGVRVDEVPPGLGTDGALVDDAVTDASTVYGTGNRVDVHDGRWLDPTVSVVDDSPVPVRVTDVSTPSETDGGTAVLDAAEVTVPVDELGGDGSWRPLGGVARVSTSCGTGAAGSGSGLSSAAARARGAGTTVTRSSRPTSGSSAPAPRRRLPAQTPGRTTPG